MTSNKKVILKSFLGTLKPKARTSSKENYWQLIGEKGIVISENFQEHKLLVLFDKNLDDLELENHNPIKNSLWIRKSDLES